MSAETLISIRELDARVSDGIQVRLLWCERSGELWVVVLDTRTGDVFRLQVRDGESPSDVFHHPFAYAVGDRVEAPVESGPRDGVPA